MPVIRPPNFVDRTGDVPADRFFIRVGNEQSGSLHSIPLTDVLKNLKAFASRPDTILGDGNLLTGRDHAFSRERAGRFSAHSEERQGPIQPCALQLQSAPGSPAVLSILVTRQGTSIQVIENKPDDATAAGWGQELYFNNKGSARRSPPNERATSSRRSRRKAVRDPKTTGARFRGAPTCCSSCRFAQTSKRGPSRWAAPRRRRRQGHPCPRRRRRQRWHRRRKLPRRATSSRRSSVTVRTSAPTTRDTD